MSTAPFKTGDKVVALRDGFPDPNLSGTIVKGSVYTVRDWHEGHSGGPGADKPDPSPAASDQIVNVTGIEGAQVWHNQQARMVEYGWHHAWFRLVWRQKTAISSTAEREVSS